MHPFGDDRLHWVTEGSTELAVPRINEGQQGPGRTDPEAPFYNPAMGLNRDLSVLTLQVYANHKARNFDVADVLCGTGARTLRFAKEVDGDFLLHGNDGDPSAIERLQQGAHHLGVADKIHAARGNAHQFLTSRRFDVIDVDPFGSPIPFLDVATYACRHDGLLMLTATDTGCLSGTYPKPCRRRYGAEPYHRAPWRSEVGLRILLAAAARSAGRFERGIEPVWSLATGHWMRVVVRLKDGRGIAEKTARAVQPGFHDSETDQLRFGEGPIGPLWSGPLHDASFLREMQLAAVGRTLAAPKKVDKMLGLMQEEAGGPAGSTDLHFLQKHLGVQETPRRKDLLAVLHEMGYFASRTHLEEQSIRTDAPITALVEAFQRASASPPSTK